MSHSSKRTIFSTAAGVLLVVAYVIYALGESSPAPEDLQAWAVAMLVFIGVSVAIIIVVHILFHIALAIGIAAREKMQGREPDENVGRIMESSMMEDEREKLIGLKSTHIGSVLAGFGFFAALIALAVGASAVAVLHIIFGAFAAGSIAEGIARVWFYEKGVRNG